MPLLFPTQGTLSDAFSPLPFGRAPGPDEEPPVSKSHKSQQPRYPAWSAAEELKSKAGTLSEEARTELKKAGQIYQPTTGTIELYSQKYYSTCIIGGLIACVCYGVQVDRAGQLIFELGSYSYRRHPVGPRQMPTPGRLEVVQGKLRGLGQDWSSGGSTWNLHRMESHSLWILCMDQNV